MFWCHLTSLPEDTIVSRLHLSCARDAAPVTMARVKSTTLRLWWKVRAGLRGGDWAPTRPTQTRPTPSRLPFHPRASSRPLPARPPALVPSPPMRLASAARWLRPVTAVAAGIRADPSQSVQASKLAATRTAKHTPMHVGSAALSDATSPGSSGLVTPAPVPPPPLPPAPHPPWVAVTATPHAAARPPPDTRRLPVQRWRVALIHRGPRRSHVVA